VFGYSDGDGPNPFREAATPKQWARLARRFLRDESN
jgi:hypothetical protein